MLDNDRQEHPERALIQSAIRDALQDLEVTTSPFAKMIAARIRNATSEHVVMTYRIGSEFTQGNEVIQGGMVSAMLDQAMVFAAFSTIPQEATVATICQTTNFLRAVLPGEIRVDGEIEKAGRSIVHARATLYDHQDALCASAVSTLAVIGPR